jgi:type II secretory pathway component PulF
MRVPPRILIIFTQQLASMLRQGVPVLQALEALAYQPECPLFGEVIREISAMLQSGAPLSRSLATYGGIFGNIYCTMAQIGEQTGTIVDALEKLGSWLQQDDTLRQRLKSALTYPAFLIILLTVLTVGLSYTVLPGFVDIFADLKVELPLITRVVIAICNGLRNPAVVMGGLALLAGLGIGFRKWVRTPRGAQRSYRICLNIPLVGGILTFAGLARYCAALDTLLTTGMEITRALRYAAAASGSPVIDSDGPAMVDSIIHGKEVSQHMSRRPDIYPRTLVNLVASGEETSHMPKLLGRASAFYDEEMNYKIQAFAAAIEPVILGAVSTVVGTFILAIFLPMYACISKLGE